MNRDPIEEQGGLNVYGMVCNRLLDAADALGLWIIEHTSEKAYAIAKRERKGEDLFYLSRKTGLSYSEILGWARKSSSGEKFNSIEEAQRACVVYLPNQVIEVLPQIERIVLRREFSKALRASLLNIGQKYVDAGFMVVQFDFEVPDISTKTGMGMMTGWPTMGLLIGGHGAPPLKLFYKDPPAVGSIEVEDGNFLAPDDFTGDRDYKLQTLLVFGCFVGHNTDWRNLGVSPGSHSISVSGPGFHTLLGFPYGLQPPTW